MRVSVIEVSKFLCFRNLTLNIDPDLQLIAGPNNAGKSSVVRMLEFFFSDPSGGDLMALQPLNSYFTEAGARTLSSVSVWFTDLTDDERQTFSEVCRRSRETARRRPRSCPLADIRTTH